ncbi:hypothetical protein C8R45DRAFT_1188537 [Mycena sanguinolenta]|nr:hypothetical protein C8R45DRAFT_1188537 [Mycena sanguinolenta]
MPSRRSSALRFFLLSSISGAARDPAGKSRTYTSRCESIHQHATSSRGAAFFPRWSLRVVACAHPHLTAPISAQRRLKAVARFTNPPVRAVTFTGLGASSRSLPCFDAVSQLKNLEKLTCTLATVSGALPALKIAPRTSSSLFLFSPRPSPSTSRTLARKFPPRPRPITPPHQPRHVPAHALQVVNVTVLEATFASPPSAAATLWNWIACARRAHDIFPHWRAPPAHIPSSPRPHPLSALRRLVLDVDGLRRWRCLTVR